MIDEWRVNYRGLVHDVLHYTESTDGVETGCGFILPSKGKVSHEPTSCLRCISGNMDYERAVNALKLMKNHGIVLDEAAVNELTKKYLT